MVDLVFFFGIQENFLKKNNDGDHLIIFKNTIEFLKNNN